MTDEDIEAEEAWYAFLTAAEAWLKEQRGGPLTGLLVYLSQHPDTKELRVLEAHDPSDTARWRQVYENLSVSAVIKVIQPREDVP